MVNIDNYNYLLFSSHVNLLIVVFLCLMFSNHMYQPCLIKQFPYTFYSILYFIVNVINKNKSFIPIVWVFTKSL